MLRRPNSLLASPLATTVVVATVLGWFGWRLAVQHRALDDQRVREQLEQRADLVAAAVRGKLAETGERLSAWLASPASPVPVIDGAVILAVGPDGAAVSPDGGLPFVPAVEEPSPPGAVFDGIERIDTLAAQALVRMAECYGKLGDSQARTPFEQVIREYGDQAGAVAEARAHLRSRDAVALRAGMVHRKVWSGKAALDASEGSVSPDGRYISYPHWETGNLASHDLVTGTSRRLTSGGYVEPRDAYAQNSSISRDGRQIVYTWFNGMDGHELRLIGLPATGIPEPRRLFSSHETSYIVPFDWTPDGKWIAVQNQRKDRTSQLGLVSTTDGSMRVLKSVGWQGTSRLALSPDGRYTAFDLSTSDTSNDERDVFVLATDGSRETAVVAAPGDDRIVGWSPDGAWLLFASVAPAPRRCGRSLWKVGGPLELRSPSSPTCRSGRSA